MLKKHVGYLFICLALLELSLLPVISSIGASSLGTIPLLFLTFMTATIVSLALVLYKKRLGDLSQIMADKRTLAIIVVAGLLNYAIAQLFLTLGVLGTNPIVTSLILKLWPIFMAMMIPFALRIKVKPSQFVALFIGFIGVYVLVTSGTLSLSAGTGITIFVLFVIISTLATATSNVIIRAHNYDMYVQIFLFNLASFVLFAILLLATGNPATAFANINMYSILSFLFLGGITYSIGAFMFFYALKVLNPMLILSAGYATPILTIMFSVVLLHTAVYGYYFEALAIILLALIIQRRLSTKAPRHMPKKSDSKDRFLFDVTGAFLSNRGAEMSSYIRGNGRALAVNLHRDTMPHLEMEELNRSGCIFFTSDKPHSEVLSEELDFIKDTMATGDNEFVLIGVGNMEKVEGMLNGVPNFRPPDMPGVGAATE